MTRRALVVVIILAATGLLAHAARRVHPIVIDVSRLPYAVAGWTGRDDPPPDRDTLAVLSADALLNRTYTSRAGAPAAVGLYVAFYSEQKPGVSIHSPLHCLPGTGWEPVDVGVVDMTGGTARRMVVRKNRDRALVLYWYAVHGRMLAGEVSSRLWLLHDSVRFGRSDAALVRIVVPVTSSLDSAERRAVSFARDVMPYLSHLWS